MVIGGTLNGLGVVRSLARGGMPVYLLETTRNCAAGWSRHCTYVHVDALEGPELTEALVALGTRLGVRPVLILTSDQSVNWVSAHREDIEPLYRISLPADDIVRALADKTLFQELAEREGFPVPRAACVTSRADIEHLAALTPPLILKPADKTLVLSGLVERVVQAATIGEAQRACAEMLTCAPRIIVQEWIDGPDSEIFFTLFSCDSEGRLLGLFPGRKLLCSPPAIGSTAVCIAAPEMAEELAATTLEFIARLGYRGLGSLEFKRDARSGRCLIIEPTVGRTDWQEEIATLCGVNLALLTYHAEVGENSQAPSDTHETSLAWRASVGVRTRLPPPVRAVDGYFRWSDPLPALYYYGWERGLWRVGRAIASATAVLSRNDRQE